MKAKAVFLFPNGNVAVTNEEGHQMPKVQGSLFDYTYIRRLARRIVTDRPELHGYDPLVAEYVRHYESNLAWVEEEEAEDEALLAAMADVLRWSEERKRVIEAGDFAVMLLRGLLAPLPGTSGPTLGQLEDAIRTWDRATGNT